MQIKLSEKLERITERLGSDFLFVALQFKNYLTDIGCRIHENWSQRERLVFWSLLHVLYHRLNYRTKQKPNVLSVVFLALRITRRENLWEIHRMSGFLFPKSF